MSLTRSALGAGAENEEEVRREMGGMETNREDEGPSMASGT